VELYKRVRSRAVLHRAWAKVRQSGLGSDSERTVRETRYFDDEWLNGLEKIRSQLKAGTFKFSGEKGITPPKGKGKVGVRPLVLSPIPNRIVRRAILEVLQGFGIDAESKPRRRWAGVPAVREVMATPTSVGGIAERGVPQGLAIVERAVFSGAHWFVRSDIKNFFTRIPKPKVSKFVRSAIGDDKFADLFDHALATNLENQAELEERRQFILFPDSEVGVAQGSALSALAGNISLQEFDRKMNGKGIICVRYIDDFILLGRKEAHVRAAYESARKHLQALDMDVYDLEDSTARRDSKVDAGNLHHGTDFLGYRISGNSRQPNGAAQKSLLKKLDKIVADAKDSMKAAVNGGTSARSLTYHAALIEIHKTVRGWSQSFRHTTARHVFRQLDIDVDKRIEALEMEALRLAPHNDNMAKRRVRGIHLLADTPEAPLDELIAAFERLPQA
jgi:RNA-directed DNA polymerase